MIHSYTRYEFNTFWDYLKRKREGILNFMTVKTMVLVSYTQTYGLRFVMYVHSVRTVLFSLLQVGKSVLTTIYIVDSLSIRAKSIINTQQDVVMSPRVPWLRTREQWTNTCLVTALLWQCLTFTSGVLATFLKVSIGINGMWRLHTATGSIWSYLNLRTTVTLLQTLMLISRWNIIENHCRQIYL